MSENDGIPEEIPFRADYGSDLPLELVPAISTIEGPSFGSSI